MKSFIKFLTTLIAVIAIGMGSLFITLDYLTYIDRIEGVKVTSRMNWFLTHNQ